MKFFVDFYKELDAVNLIIFWGVIIVVLLLLIFAIIIANKNKKLERIIEKNGIDIDSYPDDPELAIKKEESVAVNNEITKAENVKENVTPVVIEKEAPAPLKEEPFVEFPVLEEPKKETFTEFPAKEEPKKEVVEPVKEEKFVAEEHVMEYYEDSPKQSVTPYQRNILREISSNQTSPIGIARNDTPKEREMNNAMELHRSLENEEETLINQKNYINTYTNQTRKGDYLEELSRKLSNANDAGEINRTPYEIEQEENAIISYEELMRQKDNLKTIDEEEAIISIDELIKKQNDDKVYNITKEENDDEFISELKHFRKDL